MAEYGKDLLEFVTRMGVLTAQLVGLAQTVVGVDASATLIDKAIVNYPEIEFMVCDALTLPFRGHFDVVFSNAVFYWIAADHDALLANWMRQFFASDLEAMPEEVQAGIIADVENATREALWSKTE